MPLESIDSLIPKVAFRELGTVHPPYFRPLEPTRVVIFVTKKVADDPHMLVESSNSKYLGSGGGTSTPLSPPVL